MHKRIIENALQFKISNSFIKNMRKKFQQEAFDEIKDFETKKLKKDS